jgi:hypothetical protein
MQSRKNIEEKYIRFTSAEIKELKELIEEISFIIKHSKITEEGLRRLLNAHRTLDNFKDSYTLRLISILKQNHMLN